MVRNAQLPSAVSQRGVFAAIVVVERDEGKAVGQGGIAAAMVSGLAGPPEPRRCGRASCGRFGRLRRRSPTASSASTPRPCPGPCGNLRERRRAGGRTAGRNQSGKWPAGGWRENSDIQGQAFLRSKRQMHQAIFHFAIEHQLRFDFLSFHISRRRRRQTDGVVFQNSLHFLAALLPLFDGGDFGPVVHRQHIGHFLADGQFVDAGHRAQRRFDRRDGNFFRIGPGWAPEVCGGLAAASSAERSSEGGGQQIAGQWAIFQLLQSFDHRLGVEPRAGFGGVLVIGEIFGGLLLAESIESIGGDRVEIDKHAPLVFAASAAHWRSRRSRA